jgi:hypothetical protein
MTTEYADIWVYPDRIEVRQKGIVTETVAIDHPDTEAWGDLVTARVVPVVRERHWHMNTWHRPRNNDAVLATTFAWRDR